MDKSLAKYLSAFKGLDFDYRNKPVDPEFIKSDSDLDAILDEIFAVDPVSGLPRGDFQYYMSVDGNPQVKQWLETHLLQPRMIGNKTPAEVTDDMIVEMSRKSDESVDDYQSRLMSIYDSAKADYEKSLVPPSE